MSEITHYDGCWADPKHHACAVREIERLRQHLAERLIDYCVCNNCNSPTGGCNCVACTTKRLEAEIERLRDRVKWFEEAGGVTMATRIHTALSEIERLRGALETITIVDVGDGAAGSMRKIALQALRVREALGDKLF